MSRERCHFGVRIDLFLGGGGLYPRSAYHIFHLTLRCWGDGVRSIQPFFSIGACERYETQKNCMVDVSIFITLYPTVFDDVTARITVLSVCIHNL